MGSGGIYDFDGQQLYGDGREVERDRDVCLVHGREMQYDFRSGFTICPDCENPPAGEPHGNE